MVQGGQVLTEELNTKPNQATQLLHTSAASFDEENIPTMDDEASAKRLVARFNYFLDTKMKDPSLQNFIDELSEHFSKDQTEEA